MSSLPSMPPRSLAFNRFFCFTDSRDQDGRISYKEFKGLHKAYPIALFPVFRMYDQVRWWPAMILLSV